MKIICIARNYSEHAAEMGAPRFQRGSVEALSPAFFLKPENALLVNDKPFPYPSFSNRVEYETELVVRIDRNGHNIPVDHARQYYSRVTLGIDFTARDIQSQAKAKGLPWTLSKGFDNSALVGGFQHLDQLGGDVQNLSFKLLLNGATVQSGHTSQMLCSVDMMISYISRYISLDADDLIFTGTPAGVGPVQVGDFLEGRLEGRTVFTCNVVR